MCRRCAGCGLAQRGRAAPGRAFAQRLALPYGTQRGAQPLARTAPPPNLPLEEAVAGDWLLAPQPTEAEELIQALVDALPEPDREIFIRRYYFLEPAAEIGRAVGMAAHTVTVRLSRGRDKLRRQFIQAQKEEVRHV